MTGLADGSPPIVDVHHTRHPRTRDRRGERGVSLMSDADYSWLRDRYGDHLLDGVAGETITLTGASALAGRDLGGAALIETADGLLPLIHLRAADPCVEFSRWVLQLPADHPVDSRVRATLAVLDAGRREFVAATSGAGVVSAGDRLFLAAGTGSAQHVRALTWDGGAVDADALFSP